MGIFRRTADIFAANLNDLVDRFEEPEKMLRHALREMETLQASTSSATARSIAMEKVLTKSRAEHLTQADEWRRRAAEALDEGEETLVRRALARKLVDHERAAATVSRQLTDVQEANETLRNQLDILRSKRESARVKLMMLAAQQTAVEAQRQVVTMSRTPHGNAQALARFERFYEQAEFAQAEATALLELENHDDLALESEIDRKLRERTIDDELTRLKANISSPSSR